MKLFDYQAFVSDTTSPTSYNDVDFVKRMDVVEGDGLNVPLLITASIGMSSEVGEFNEIVKKILFQGKEYNKESRYHMQRELGDILWYFANACTALGFDMEDVLLGNVYKLQQRYPNGFTVENSENRKEGDL